jgi:polar amino acid transport system substrate-binding protein
MCHFLMKTIIIISLGILPASLYALDLTIYTEEFAPFNYTQQQKITGVSTEVVQRVMALTGYNVNIISLPWNDTYKRAQKESNTLIYSISRRKNREHLFKWVGVLTPATYSAMTLTSRKDIQVNQLEDMKHYKIGTNKDDASEQWLVSNGFELSNFIRTTGKYSLIKNFKNLLNKRIDLWPAPDAVAYYTALQQGHSNPDAVLKPVYTIDALSDGYYLAGSLQTSDTVIATIDAALKKFKKTDEYYKIIGHWGVNAIGMRTTEPIAKLVYMLKHFARIGTVGYLANDTLSAHNEGGLYRKEIGETLIEMYADDFDMWRQRYSELQDQVDAMIIGDISQLKNRQKEEVMAFVQRATKIPTSYVLDGMAELAMVGYDGDNLTVNMKIAKSSGIKIPKTILKQAVRIIQ